MAMKVLFWQGAIVISIIALFVGAKFARQRISEISKNHPSINKQAKKITPASVGIAGAGGWALWTLIMLSGPLLIFQLGVIGFVLFACLIILMIFRKKDTATEELKKEKKRIQTRFNELSKSFDLLKREKESSVRWVMTSKAHRRILLSTLRTAKQRIIILSGWLTDRAFDDDFRSLILEALQRGVEVYIGYGYRQKGEAKITRKEQKTASAELFGLQEWCAKNKPKGRLNVWNYPNHAKLLLKDRSYVICGSFNWLSNSGGGVNEEMSCGIGDSSEVDKFAKRIIEDFDNRPPDRRGFLKTFVPWSDY